MKDNWIKVVDRLPDIKQHVHCYISDKGFNSCNHIITQYTKYGFEGSNKVTHWQPLEQPTNE